MPWRWAFHDLFHSLFLPTSQYNRPRRYFMLEMNHRTKGDCESRNFINDHSITWWKRGSYFMFKLLSPAKGQPSCGAGKPNAVLRQDVSGSKSGFLTINNSSLTAVLLCARRPLSPSQMLRHKSVKLTGHSSLCFQELHTRKIESHHCHRAWAARRILQDLWNKSH